MTAALKANGRNSQDEPRFMLGRGLQPQIAAVSAGDFAGDAKPQAKSLHLATAGGVRPIETLENPVAISDWNARR